MNPEDVFQLHQLIQQLGDRVLELELQLSVALVQLKEHRHQLLDLTSGQPILLEEQQLAERFMQPNHDDPPEDNDPPEDSEDPGPDPYADPFHGDRNDPELD